MDAEEAERRRNSLNLLVLTIEISGNVFYKILDVLRPKRLTIGIKEDIKDNGYKIGIYMTKTKWDSKNLDALKNDARVEVKHLDLNLLYKLIFSICEKLSKDEDHWNGKLKNKGKKYFLEQGLFLIKEQKNIAVHEYRIRLPGIQCHDLDKDIPHLSIEMIKTLLREMIQIASEKASLSFSEKSKWEQDFENDLKALDRNESFEAQERPSPPSEPTPIKLPFSPELLSIHDSRNVRNVPTTSLKPRPMTEMPLTIESIAITDQPQGTRVRIITGHYSRDKHSQELIQLNQIVQEWNTWISSKAELRRSNRSLCIIISLLGSFILSILFIGFVYDYLKTNVC